MALRSIISRGFFSPFDRVGKLPARIYCKRISLETVHGSEEVYGGSGHIHLRSLGLIEFRLSIENLDFLKAARLSRENAKDPYDLANKLRLTAIDERDQSWNGGYVDADFGLSFMNGYCSGRIHSLSTNIRKSTSVDVDGVELGFLPELDLPFSRDITQTTLVDGEEVSFSRSWGFHEIDVSGSSVQLFNDPDSDYLWITANCSMSLQHPYLENWLTEPLSILLGRPIGPHIVTRLHKDGRAAFTIRATSDAVFESYCGLRALSRNDKEFWEFFKAILIAVAENAEFERYLVTRLFDEVSLSQQTTLWLELLTLAGAIESLAKPFLVDPGEVPARNAEEMERLRKHVKSWAGDKELRGRLLGFISSMNRPSPLSLFRKLAMEQRIDSEDVLVWQRIRNQVMHGELSNPWSDLDIDNDRRCLMRLFHDLACLRLGIIPRYWPKFEGDYLEF